MKCDVCDTKIPLGSNTCPNCGYKMGKLHVNTYDASGKTYEHIQTKQTKKYVRPQLDIPQLSFGKLKSVGLVILVALIVIVVTLVSIPRYLNREGTYENLSYQELVDQGYDEKLVKMAIADEKDLIEFFQTEIGVEEPEINEYSQKVDGKTRLETEVTGYLDDRVYSIKYIYSEENDVIKSMYTIRDTQESIKDAKTFEGDQKILDAMGERIGVHNVYNIIDHSRTLMESDTKDNHLSYSDYENGIYLSENYYGQGEQAYYSYYCSIQPNH